MTTTCALQATLRQNDLIYDVGMHRGEDTDYYLKKGFRVIGFEADPDLAAMCRERFHSHICAGALTIVEGAIVKPNRSSSAAYQPHSVLRCTRTPAKVDFYKTDSRTEWGSVDHKWAVRNEKLGISSRLIAVDAIDFRAVMEKQGLPHYLKIDIEGMDMECIAALRHFEMRPSYLSIEINKTSYDAMVSQLNEIRDLGYDSFQAVEQTEITNRQSPPHPAREGVYVDHHFVFSSSGLFGSELGGKWKSQTDLLRQCRAIATGFYWVGDSGVLTRRKYPGAKLITAAAKRLLRLYTGERTPGWYDLHARHRDARTE
jgi:FkbM family methyltransferase